MYQIIIIDVCRDAIFKARNKVNKKRDSRLNKA
jgi:hypothetical protein